MSKLPISVVINTKNSQKYLSKALKSCDFADDIVLVDMGSNDETLSIAKKFTNRIFQYDDIGFVEPARNFAISKAKHNWVLVLDADEEVSKGLATKLPALIESNVEVYDIPRQNIVFNKWLEHAGWWPDYQRRLFKKGHVIWQDTIHSIPTVTGKTKRLAASPDNAIIHHNYQTIEQYLDRLNHYTTIEARQHADQITSQAKVAREGFAELFRRFFKEEGFRDNMHGLSVTMLQMFYQIIKELKIWQAQGFAQVENELVWQFPQIIKEFKYWYAYYRQKTTKNPLVKLFWRIRMHFKI